MVSSRKPGDARAAGRRWAICLLLLLAGCAAPRVHAPATAVLHDDPADNPDRLALIALTGRGFGVRGVVSGVRLRSADGEIALASTDRARVPLWTAQRIVLAVPERVLDAPSLELEVTSGPAVSTPVPLARFVYRHADVPRSDPGTNPSPLALALDERSRVAVNEEFHTQLKRLDGDARWEVFDLPRGRAEGIFASQLFGDAPTRVTSLGEAVVVDGRGRTWTTEGGTALYGGRYPNHSRIVMLPPDGGPPQLWPVPGDDNSVIGLAVDPDSGRIFFTQARRSRREPGGVEHVAYPARLTSFDPAAIPPDSDFDFAPRERCELPPAPGVGRCSETRHRRCLDDDDCVLADRVCAPDATDDRACFREHPIPTPVGAAPLWLPGPLLRHGDGTLFVAGFWGGNDLWRFDPRSDAFQRYPFARPPGERSCDLRGCTCFAPEGSDAHPCPARCCLYALIGRGPWGLVEDAGGAMAICSQEAGMVSRLPAERFDDPRCAALDADGQNPCLVEHLVPGFDPTRDQMHSLARDDDGDLWFTQGRAGLSDTGPDGRDDPARGAALGFVQAGTGHVILLPPLSLFPYTSSGVECHERGRPVPFLGAGIAFDPRTRSLWFADFCRKRLGQLVPQAAPRPR